MYSLLPKVKNKKAEDFVSMKEATPTIKKQVAIRMPSTLLDTLKEISKLTGISINALCLEMIRSAANRKLKQLKQETN